MENEKRDGVMIASSSELVESALLVMHESVEAVGCLLCLLCSRASFLLQL